MEGGKEGKKDEQRGGERDESPAEAVLIFKASNAISAWPAGESRWTKQVSSLTPYSHTHTRPHECTHTCVASKWGWIEATSG